MKTFLLSAYPTFFLFFEGCYIVLINIRNINLISVIFTGPSFFLVFYKRFP